MQNTHTNGDSNFSLSFSRLENNYNVIMTTIKEIHIFSRQFSLCWVLKVDTILVLNKSLICSSGKEENYVDSHAFQELSDVKRRRRLV